MIEDEMSRRKVSADFEQTSARPMPRTVNIAELLVVAIVVAATAMLIWFL
jgi:hypothetical protein